MSSELSNLLVNKTGSLIEIYSELYPPLVPFENNDTINIFEIYQDIIQDSNDLTLFVSSKDLSKNIKFSNNGNMSTIFVSSDNELKLMPEIDDSLREAILSVTGLSITSNSESSEFSKISCDDLLQILNTDENQSEPGIGGDPYIVTLDNKIYKMSNFQGYSRMIQGFYMNKLLTVNVSTRMSTKEDAEKSRLYVIDNLKKIEKKYKGSTSVFEVMNYLNKNEAFMDKIFIKWGNKDITLDMDKLEILENNSDFVVEHLGKNTGRSFKDTKLMEHYKQLNDYSMAIKINQLVFIISTINNPQFRTGLKIENSYLINNPQGGLVHQLYDEESSFVLEFNCPRYLGINKKSIGEYTDNLGIESGENIIQYWFPSYSWEKNKCLNNHWPPKVGDRVKGADKTNEQSYDNIGTRWWGEVIKVNEPDTWVGPYSSSDDWTYKAEPDLSTPYKTAGPTELDSTTLEETPGSGNWYVKFSVTTWDIKLGPNPLSMDPDNFTYGNTYGNVLQELDDITTSWDIQDVRTNNYIRNTSYAVGATEPHDWRTLWSIYTWSLQQFVGVKKPNGQLVAQPPTQSRYYPDAVLTPTSIESNAYIKFADLQRLKHSEDNGEGESNSYGRLVLQPRPIDLNMKLKAGDNYINSISTELPLDESSTMYGEILKNKYVYSSSKFLTSEAVDIDYGDNFITKQYGMFWNFNLDQSNPNYDTKIGVYISMDNQANLVGQIGDNTRGNSTLDAEVCKRLVAKADGYYTYLKEPSQVADDNLFETFDILSRGTVIQRNELVSLFEIPNYDSIPVTKNSVGKIIDRHLKLGSIFIVDSTDDIFVSEKLINCGLIYIKAGGKLTIRDNNSAILINNGVIVNHGNLVLENSSHPNSSLLNHVSNVKTAVDQTGTEVGPVAVNVNEELKEVYGIIYRDDSIRFLKDYLHNVPVAARTQKLVTQVDLRYTNQNSILYSDQSSLATGTNLTETTRPEWNDHLKLLSFKYASVLLTGRGLVTPRFYTVFIPDYLVSKLFNKDRVYIENNMNSQEGIELFKINYETGVREKIDMNTNKIVNSSMSGLYVTIPSI